LDRRDYGGGLLRPYDPAQTGRSVTEAVRGIGCTQIAMTLTPMTLASFGQPVTKKQSFNFAKSNDCVRC